MKYSVRLGSLVLLCCASVLPVHAVVLLDDTWADGTRTVQNLPVESAWYVSTGSQLSSATGAMNLAVGSGSVMAITYFTSNSASPVRLSTGDTLAVTLTLTLTGVAVPNTSQGLRLALCDFADSSVSRLTSDSFSTSSQGSGVQGYGLFQNMGTVFNNSSPMDLRNRTNLTSSALLATGSDWASRVTGPGNTNLFSGFTDGSYVLQLLLQRTGAGSLAISMTWLNNASGASLTTSFSDNSATNFNFDGFAIRPAGASSSASTITFNEMKVELIPGSTPPSISIQPQDQVAFTGQNATFNVLAAGTPPLSYQWYYNTDTLLDNATNSALMLTNVQLSDAGNYLVIITNSSGSVTSDLAQLTVTVPVEPSILTQPEDQTVLPGGNVQFSVVAGGSEPLVYQWYYNTNTVLAGATDSILTLTNIQPEDAGSYSVVVSNLAGSLVSSNAFLMVNTNPVAPVFVTQPSSQVVLIGSTATLAALAAGTAPITYQWNKNNVPISGQTFSTLNLSNVQIADDGNYTVTASNNVGSVISSAALLTVTPPIPVANSAYNLTGFGQATTGGGVLPDTDPNYAKVFTATDLANALNSKTVKVIEVVNDLDLGYSEIEASAKATSEPFRAANPPLLHPVLLQTGVSLIDVQKKNGLTIFSANGSTIRHAKLNIKNCSNIIVRNLKFDQLWEWDELTKGDYDENDWDFITLGDGGAVSNVWVDHCTFTKSYDGILDTKAGCSGITLSWCKYTGDDGATNTNSWVRQQINSLESSLASGTNKMYTFLRTRGFSVEDIVTIMQGHDKTHLAGQNDFDSNNATISMTFHHLWLNSVWDRCVPRLRAGNVHDYNLYIDDISVLAAKRLRDSIAATMSTADQNTLNNTYSFDPPINGSISTENGALLVEKSVYIDCLWPLRNNQTDPSNPAYTGKIKALDTIYQMDSTIIRGDSTDPGNPLGPLQAPVIPFSWNLPGNQLPYSYTLDDPAQLQAIVTSPTAGAGAGVLTWDKTNWLVTAYPPSAPVIVADPQSRTVAAGDSVTFVVVAGGSGPLSYQWYFNTNTPVASATNAVLTLTNVQADDAGGYSVVVSNSIDAVSSQAAVLSVSNELSGFAAWQAAEFTPQQLSDPSISGPNATPAGDGVPNLVKYALGLEPFVPAAQPLVGFRLQSGMGILSYQRPAEVPDVAYVIQVSSNLVNWTTNGVVQQVVGTNDLGLQNWEGDYPVAGLPDLFFRLLLEY